ncbi:BLUF domain-containing protein [Fibrella aquatica]|uniref:BLUF domain-containing protein n=1 Tax=Fibrella aquatica TaxID=3242487 RepID=UPI003521418E
MESCIIYFSRAVGPFEEQLTAMLEQSRRTNALLGITGVFLYVRGSIIQVLEGEQQAVEAVYRRIEADPRHHQLERILTRPITHRLFTDLSMGYETINHSQLDQIKAAFPLEGELPPGDEPLVLRVIRTFYEANRFNQMPFPAA